MACVPTVIKDLKNIFEELELDKKVVVSKMEITTPQGAMNDKFQTHNADFYHLDTIIVIGNSMDSTTQQIDSDCDKEVRR